MAVRASPADYETLYNQSNAMVIFDHGSEDPDMDMKMLDGLLFVPTVVTQNASEETLVKARALLGTISVPTLADDVILCVKAREDIVMREKALKAARKAAEVARAKSQSNEEFSKRKWKSENEEKAAGAKGKPRETRAKSKDV